MRVALMVVAFLSAALTANALEWVSKNGKIALNAPSSARFTSSTDFTPPLVAKWESKDGMAAIGVVEVDNPRNIPLVKSSLERGFCKEIDGTIILSEETSLSGVPLFRMAAKGSIGGKEVYFMQSVLAFGGRVYKVIGSSAIGDVSQDPDVAAVFESFRILAPSPQATTGGGSDQVDPVTDISEKVGGWGIILLLVCGVIVLVKRRKKAAEHTAPGDAGTPPA